MADLPDFIPDSMVNYGAPVKQAMPDFIPDTKVSYPERQPLSFGETITGGFGNLLNATTFNMGDEITAGGASLVDALMGKGSTYDQRLAQTRDLNTRYRDENPIAATANDIGSFFLMPFKGLKAGGGITKTALKTGAEGAAYGTAYGFGAGEGGLENRLEEAKDSALEAGLTSAALGGGMKAITKGAGALSQALPKWSEKVGNDAFGATVADYNKSGRNQGWLTLKDGSQSTKLERAFKQLRANGILKGAKSADDILQNHKEQSLALAQELNKYINIADEALGTQKVYPTKFKHAEEFLKTKAPKDEVGSLTKELKRYIDGIKEYGEGTVRELQNQKEALYNKAYPEGGKTRQNLDQAIARDLKEAIEQYTDQLLPKKYASAVKRTNRKLAPYEETRRILEQRSTVERTTKDGNRFKQFMRTSGGFGTGMGAGLYMGNAPGMVAGAAIGKAIDYSMTPAGSALRSDLYAKAAPMVKKSLPALQAVENQVLPQLPKISGISSPSPDEAPLYGAPLVRGQDGSESYQAFQGLTPQPSQLPEGSTNRSTQSQSADTQMVAPLASQNSGEQIRNKLSEEQQIGASSNYPPVPDPKQPASYTPEKVKEIVADQPPLIRAMVKQESGGKPKARSNKGASGLMQILPSTAKEIASELGVEDYDLEDPLTSLIFGKHYIQKMYQEFNDPRLALAAYNAGPGKVKQWIKRWGRDWSTISRGLANTNQFSETRNYVRNIVNNAKEYA